eukprot:7419993-Pyramimonas_sp.AAC.1
MTEISYLIKAAENYSVKVTQKRTTKKCFNITVMVRQKYAHACASEKGDTGRRGVLHDTIRPALSKEPASLDPMQNWLQAHFPNDVFPRRTNAQCDNVCEDRGKTQRRRSIKRCNSGIMKLS